MSNFEEQLKQENVMFKLSDLDLDDLLTKYGNDREYGKYKDYEVYKNYSLSKESWIDFIEVKYIINQETKEHVFKYFSLVVIKGYLCAFDEVTNKNMLYFEAYLEDLLSLVMIKSLKYDYIMLQNNIKNQEKIKSDSELNNEKDDTPPVPIEKKPETKEEPKMDIKNINEKLDFKKEENIKDEQIINSTKSKEENIIKKEYTMLEDIDEIDNLNFNALKTIFNALDLNSIAEENIPNFYKDDISVLKAKLKAIYLQEAAKNTNTNSNYIIVN